jgi:hypothetical protein
MHGLTVNLSSVEAFSAEASFKATDLDSMLFSICPKGLGSARRMTRKSRDDFRSE